MWVLFYFHLQKKETAHQNSILRNAQITGIEFYSTDTLSAVDGFLAMMVQYLTEWMLYSYDASHSIVSCRR